MKLSRTIAYGIQAAIQLARLPGPAPVPSSQLAREGRLPERFLVQILRSLVTSGVLISSRGPLGGYSLARPPEQITLRDIVESFDNPLDVCLPDLDCMPESVRSSVLSTLDAASQAARAKLQTLTLADLLRKENHAGRTHADTPPAIGFQIHVMDQNGYETQTGDSPVTR